MDMSLTTRDPASTLPTDVEQLLYRRCTNVREARSAPAHARARRRSQLGPRRDREVRPGGLDLRPGLRRDERREPDRLRARRPLGRVRPRLARRRPPSGKPATYPCVRVPLTLNERTS